MDYIHQCVAYNRIVKVFPQVDDNFGLEYDKEKYKEMLLDAGETILGMFGFDRTLYGKPRNKRWWDDLRKHMVNDMKSKYSQG